MTYTPTTGEVKDAYVRTIRQAFITSAPEHAAEFDRWLSTIQHDAWENGYSRALLAARAMGHELNPGYDVLDGRSINPHTWHHLGPQEDPSHECD